MACLLLTAAFMFIAATGRGAFMSIAAPLIALLMVAAMYVADVVIRGYDGHAIIILAQSIFALFAVAVGYAAGRRGTRFMVAPAATAAALLAVLTVAALFDANPFEDTNTAGILVFELGAICTLAAALFIDRWRMPVFLAIGILPLFLEYRFQARSSMLATLIFLTTIGIGARADRRTGRAALALVIAMAPIVVLLNITVVGDSDSLKQFSTSVFGKAADTGRADIWRTLLDGIRSNVLFGNGIATPTPQPPLSFHITTQNLSAHDWYLQILFQSGGVGLLLWLVAIVLPMDRLWSSSRSRIAGGFALGALAIQTFEVTLTQNNFAFGLLFWMMLGAGLALGDRPEGCPASSAEADPANEATMSRSGVENDVAGVAAHGWDSAGRGSPEVEVD
jgi:hypothetical protein